MEGLVGPLRCSLHHLATCRRDVENDPTSVRWVNATGNQPRFDEGGDANRDRLSRHAVVRCEFTDRPRTPADQVSHCRQRNKSDARLRRRELLTQSRRDRTYCVADLVGEYFVNVAKVAYVIPLMQTGAQPALAVFEETRGAPKSRR